MDKILHDYVIFEPVQDQGILKSINNDVNTGIVKGFGPGVFDYGVFVELLDISVGDKIVFTQHLQLDIDGEKLFVVRWRDIIKVKNDSKA